MMIIIIIISSSIIIIIIIIIILTKDAILFCFVVNRYCHTTISRGGGK